MTVNLRNLAAHSFAVGVTTWSYKAGEDTAGDVLSPGYWDDAATLDDCPWHKVLTEGDWIKISGNRWGMELYVIQSIGTVVVAVASAVGAVVGELPPPDGGHWA